MVMVVGERPQWFGSLMTHFLGSRVPSFSSFSHRSNCTWRKLSLWCLSQNSEWRSAVPKKVSSATTTCSMYSSRSWTRVPGLASATYAANSLLMTNHCDEVYMSMPQFMSSRGVRR